MDFIDYLASLLEVQYLSDLHYIGGIAPQKAEQILRTPEDLFSSESFNEAARYITQEEKDYPSAQAAKKAIVDELVNRKRG